MAGEVVASILVVNERAMEVKQLLAGAVCCLVSGGLGKGRFRRSVA